jgi:hypothetical protein
MFKPPGARLLPRPSGRSGAPPVARARARARAVIVAEPLLISRASNTSSFAATRSRRCPVSAALRYATSPARLSSEGGSDLVRVFGPPRVVEGWDERAVRWDGRALGPLRTLCWDLLHSAPSERERERERMRISRLGAVGGAIRCALVAPS